jgi:hypothetical protein
MTPDMDLIVGDDHLVKVTTISFVLADVSLIGGRSGIRHDEAGSGRGAQYNHIVLSHVTFKDMSEAGIVIDTIYGWDNNLIDNVSFVDCDIGIKQVVPGWYQRDDAAGMTYLDKNVFYRTQFIGGRKALQWMTKRPNNLDVFVDSRFAKASERAVESANTDSMIFANVEFIGNAGDPVVADNLPTGFVNCRFDAASRATTLLDDHALCEGCTFSAGASAPSSIGRPGAQLLLLNSRSVNMPLGAQVGGILVNSSLPGGAAYSQSVVLVRSGVPQTLVPGTAHPNTQLLARSASP